MLSKRETECLTWAANGKTAWEVAQILSISESTVVFHLENAKRKLAAVSVTHAVALAVSAGRIVVLQKGDERGVQSVSPGLHP